MRRTREFLQERSAFRKFLSAGIVVAAMIYGLTSCMDAASPNHSQTPSNSSATTLVVDADYIGAYPSLAAAPDGRLHASYYAKYDWGQSGGGALRHAVLQNGVWTPEVVDGDVYDTSVDVGQFTRIAVDAQGGLHVAYWDVTNADLKYAALPAGGTSWQIETVANLTQVCEDADLKINSDTVYIGYCDGSQILLASKTIGAAGWSAGRLVAPIGADVRAKVSLQFDGSNNLHVAFFDPGAKEIQYTVGPAVGPFQSPEVAATLVGNDETRMGLTLDGAGLPHVVFYDLVQNTLMHAYKSDATWTAVVIAQIGDTTSTSDGSSSTGYLQLSSLMDLQGRLHVSYYQGTGADFGDQDLKHVVLRNSDWAVETIETVDDAGDVGRTSAIAEDADGIIHIIYRDSTNNDLKYAYLQ